MAVLPKAIYRFKAMLSKIPAKFFTDPERTILNFIWKNNNNKKNPRIGKQSCIIKEPLEPSPFLSSSFITELE